jgi:branched-chain amino acid transport system substrate-binding protein
LKVRILPGLAVAVVLAMVATGCSREEGGGGGGAAKKVVKIGVIAPLTGPLSALGLGIKNSVDLAIKQANQKGTVSGYNLVGDYQDDAATPATGANAANKLASDDTLAGVIGTLNSSVAQQVAPVLAKASIAQISPANTNPTLTRGQKYIDAPARVWPTYFRVCTTDAVQGPFAADYASKQAGFKKVVTIHDKKTYGQGLVGEFAKQFTTKDGGKVVSAETINAGERDFGTVASKVVSAKPDFVYYGGEFPEAAPLSKQLKDRGFKGPLFGGDGIFDDNYIKGAGGKGAEGDLATSVGAPTSKLETAKQFVSDYQAAGYSEPFSAYGAFSYDATNILIQAISKSLSQGTVKDNRTKILEALNQTKDYNGVVGTTSFDEFGDTSNKVLTVYQVKSEKWADVFSGTFEGGS